MKIKIELVSGSSLQAEGVTGEQVNKVIDGFFGTINPEQKHISVSNTIMNEAKKPQTTIEKVKDLLTKNTPSVTPVVAEKETAPKLANTEPISKTLPKINADRSLHTPIGDLFMQQLPPNIREIDGMKLYQTHYTCDCGHTGRRYIRETNNYTKCHECNEKIAVEPATFDSDSDGIPKPDIDGNFFVAREMYEVEGE